MASNKKGQAAMEFLMTYGWAIIIVIAVVAALYAMGVFKLPKGGLAKCSPCFPPGSALAYVDHNADTLVLKVGPNKVSNVRVYAPSGNATNFSTFDPGSTVTLNSTGLFSGDVQVTVEYKDEESGLLHNVTATLHGA